MECPVCKDRMEHKKIEEAWVDVCENHGVWLDKGEIEAIMDSAKHKGKSEGLVSGMWSYTHAHG